MSFSRDLSQFARKAVAQAERRAREICFRTTNEIIEATPLDTGETRINWQATIDRPASGTLPASGTPEGNTAKAFANAKSAIKAAPGKVFYLTNNTPQAPVLEYGLYPKPPKLGTYLAAGESKRGRIGPGYFQFSKNGFSDIAPRGMVRITVKNIARAFK